MTVVAATTEALILSVLTPTVVTTGITVFPDTEVLALTIPVPAVPVQIQPAVINLPLSTLVPSIGYSLGDAVTDITLDTEAVFQQTGVIGGTIDIALDTRGSFVVDRAAGRTLEDRVTALGYRPSMPVYVYRITVRAAVDVSDLLHLDQFLVDNAFIDDPADLFYQDGARRAYIGTVIDDGVTARYLAFRAPDPWETVWYLERQASTTVVGSEVLNLIVDNSFYRYDVRDSVWVQFQTTAQRTLNGQYATDILDPDHIYAYYSRLVGACSVSWAYDARKLLDAYDPRTCPDVFIAYLAAQFGQAIDVSQSEDVVRRSIQQVLPLTRSRGQGPGAALSLRLGGYQGYMRPIWVDPRPAPDTENWFDADAAPPDGPSSTAVYHDVLGTLNVSVPDTFQTLGIHPRAWTGQKGVLFFEAPHGYYKHDPASLTDNPIPNYWMSSRVSVHVNNVDGTPLDMSDSPSTVAARVAQIAESLGRDALAAHVDIRYIATDFDATGTSGEALGVSDALTITEV